jgi:hypothetical protein
MLTFELEPASLGLVTVKMRLARSNVDIEIGVQSEKTMSLLNDLRDKLTQAVTSSGCKVESLDIRVSPTPASTDIRENPSEGGSQNAAFGRFDGGGGFAGSNGFAQPRQSRELIRDEPPEESNAKSADRPVDRRVNARGIYL